MGGGGWGRSACFHTRANPLEKRVPEGKWPILFAAAVETKALAMAENSNFLSAFGAERLSGKIQLVGGEKKEFGAPKESPCG